MSSILDALGQVGEAGGAGGASQSGSSDGLPQGSPSGGGDEPPQRKRPRWFSVVLVSGLGLALGVAGARLLGGAQPAAVVPAVKQKQAVTGRLKALATPKVSKVGAWPKVPRANPRLPAELTRHPGATKSTPWPLAEQAGANTEKVPVAKTPAKPKAPADKPSPANALAVLAAAHAKARAEGGEEGLKKLEAQLVILAAARKKAAKVPAPVAKPILESPPDDAPRVDILFLQWGDQRDERMASLRSQGGSLSVVHEGDVIDGMAVTSIRANEIHFTWRGATFRQPVHRY